MASPAEPNAGIPADGRARPERGNPGARRRRVSTRLSSSSPTPRRPSTALGGDVEGADEIRQASDEAAIFNARLPETLEDLLDEAGQTDSDTWASKFDTLYKGKAIIVDSWITAEPEPGGTGRYDILYESCPRAKAAASARDAVSYPLGAA